jgi:hypothetical protein
VVYLTLLTLLLFYYLKTVTNKETGLVFISMAREYTICHGPKENHIDPEKASVKYTSFDDAIRIVQQAGQNCEVHSDYCLYTQTIMNL